MITVKAVLFMWLSLLGLAVAGAIASEAAGDTPAAIAAVLWALAIFVLGSLHMILVWVNK